MCGIVGIVDLKTRRPVEPQLLQKMNDSLKHRGPDDLGVHFEEGVGLGHRRLSIIDLAGGRQPLYNEDGSVVVVFNGEIYNFSELRAKLEARGHVFKTRSDTEVIVHGWEEWGEHCVQHFRGMFAFALWDQKRSRLFLARDRLGIKPLYYSLLSTGEIIFASELKALLVHPGLARVIDPTAVEDYLAYGYVPDPKSIYQAVKKLPPGYTLAADRGRNLGRPTCYWNVPFGETPEADEDRLKDELIEHLREAVRLRLISEVPLGAFLSGGVDSSAVVALMSGLSPEPVRTCTISFGDPKYNEAAFAAQVAKRFATDHRVDEVAVDDFELLGTLADVYDEPFADSSAIPTYRVCQIARKYVTVVLSGDGGDENFLGYSRYRWHADEERLRALLPAAIRRALFGVAGRWYPKLDWAPKIFRAKSTFQALAHDSLDAYFHSVAISPTEVRQRLFSDAFRLELQGYKAIEVLKEHYLQADTEDPLARVQYLDFKTYLPGDILTKVDRASMAHGLEVRVPILDHQFVEWAARVPISGKLKGRQGKFIFKKALEGYVGRDILYREKMGFAVPISSWFRGALASRVEKLAKDSLLVQSGIFDPGFVRDLTKQHRAGERDNSALIWALFMFEGFLERH